MVDQLHSGGHLVVLTDMTRNALNGLNLLVNLIVRQVVNAFQVAFQAVIAGKVATTLETFVLRGRRHVAMSSSTTQTHATKHAHKC